MAALTATGWRPVPFHEFIIKLHSRCNLACDYCYVYESPDSSWRSQPMRMSVETIRRSAERVARHAVAHALTEVHVVLHGGEPLLAGGETIELAAKEFRAAVPPECQVAMSLQTNGVLLTEQVLDLLAVHEIGVSVSLDGDVQGHDRHRRYADGRGSHAQVMRGLGLLSQRYRWLYHGLLCTIDLANDPLRTYEALLDTGPPMIDFLFPHGTWSSPPPGRPVSGAELTPYADWLIEIFDRWYAGSPGDTGIRYFDEVLNVLLGGQSRSESVGLSPVAMVVVETDGSMQQVDTLKVAYDGAPETGLSVFTHDFEEALSHPGVVARQIGESALSDTCRGCRIRKICGGGAYAHRYRADEGYLNPSVFCPDLLKLIGHIESTVRRDLAVQSR